jgi:hypothetical protein
MALFHGKRLISQMKIGSRAPKMQTNAACKKYEIIT